MPASDALNIPEANGGGHVGWHKHGLGQHPSEPTGELPLEAWLVALAVLPAVGPARLRALLDIAEPEAVWERLQVNSDKELVAVAGSYQLFESWRRCVREVDVALLWSLHRSQDIGVAALGTPSYPQVLAADIEPPVVLFHQGDLSAIAGPCVAIVGTRRCTRYGSEVAFDLGRDLAKAGVGVVSGLALGIDAAAHAGALEAAAKPPIGVVGSGLDQVYPERNRSLWRAVAEAGVLLGEAPLGAAPERWRFPARNRIIAALVDVVVVVESHAKGGSMHTVTEALKRDKYVMAVPGPVRSSASNGCIELLADGGAPCRDAGDVLLALGVSLPETPKLDYRPQPNTIGQQVLDALGWQPADAEQIQARSGLVMTQVACAIEELRAAGWVAVSGRWIEQVAP
ncbi:MAG: DNA-processing protein DprA [bacterium]|nr:DNA-processing protein DprA [bacterium]